MTDDNKSYIVVFKIGDGKNIVEAYNEKRLLIPVDDAFSGVVGINLYKGQISKRYKKTEVNNGIEIK